MVAEIPIPDVVDVAGGIQQTIAYIGLVAGAAVAGALAFLVIRKLLRGMLEEYTDCDYAYDRWKHADQQRGLSYDNPEALEYWRQEEAYWSNRHDELSR